MNQRLVDYIKQERSLKHPDSNIQEALEKAGWKNEDILSAFNFIENESNNDQHLNNSWFAKNKITILVLFMTVLLGIAGYTGYVSFSKKSQSSVTKESKTTKSTTVTTNPVIAFLKSPPDNFAGIVVFYDTLQKKILPLDSTIQSTGRSLFELGQWSPNGHYLPVLEINNPGSDDAVINVYLYDSRVRQARKIYSAPRDKKNYIWASSSFNFLSGWMDDSQLVVHSLRDTAQGVTSLTYFTIEGELKTVQLPDVLKSVSGQLSHTITFNVDTHQKTIVVEGKTLNFAPEDTIVGVIDNKLAVLKKPPSPFADINFENGTGSSEEWNDIESQLREYEKNGMSQDELSQKMRDSLEPKGDTMVNFYNLTTGAIDHTIKLTDSTWQTLYVLVHASEKILVAHQTNKEFLPTKERFITIQFDKDPEIKLQFENDLVPEHDQNFLNRLLTQGSSFSLSSDGDWIIGERGSLVNDPQKSIVFMHNIKTNEEIIVCSEYCSNMRAYYPNAIQKRY